VTRYYLSLNTLKDAADKLLEGSRSVPGLAPGGISTGTMDVRIPDATPVGFYYLLACADDTILVAESNENNNCRVSVTRVQVIP
jgi:subtilase family serine protease